MYSTARDQATRASGATGERVPPAPGQARRHAAGATRELTRVFHQVAHNFPKLALGGQESEPLHSTTQTPDPMAGQRGQEARHTPPNQRVPSATILACRGSHRRHRQGQCPGHCPTPMVFQANRGGRRGREGGALFGLGYRGLSTGKPKWHLRMGRGYPLLCGGSQGCVLWDLPPFPAHSMYQLRPQSITCNPQGPSF